ncbi:pilin [Pseudomonas aeruginosa]
MPNQEVFFRPSLGNADKGSYTWACTSNADNKYLPKTCQTATTTTPQ